MLLRDTRNNTKKICFHVVARFSYHRPFLNLVNTNNNDATITMASSQRTSECAPEPQTMDSTYKEALESQKKAQKEARLAAVRAEEEFSNRRKCLDLERQARQSQTTELALLTTAKQTPRKFQMPVFGPGMYVEVEPDLSPGKSSNGATPMFKLLPTRTGSPSSPSNMMRTPIVGSSKKEYHSGVSKRSHMDRTFVLVRGPNVSVRRGHHLAHLIPNLPRRNLNVISSMS